MHLLTGFLLSLFLQPGAGKAAPFPRYTGPIRTRHFIEGRIRFQIDALKGDPVRARGLAADLARIDGVESCAGNAVTGSLVIRYRPGAVEPGMIFAALARLLGCEGEIDAAPRSMTGRELRAVGESVDRYVYDRSRGLLDGRTALALAVAAAGIAQLRREGMKNMPPGLMMVLWAYQSLAGREG